MPGSFTIGGETPVHEVGFCPLGDNHVIPRSPRKDVVSKPTARDANSSWSPSALATFECRFGSQFRATRRSYRSRVAKHRHLRDWFRANYDIYLHAETLTMVDDATLIFETVQHLLLLKPTRETTSDTVVDSTGGPSATAPPTAAAPSPSSLHQTDPWTTDTH